MKLSKIIVLFSFILSFNVHTHAHAGTLDIFMEILNCHKMIDLKDSIKNEKFVTCLDPYIHFKESKFVKEQIVLTFLQMEKITKPEECKGIMKKTIQSVYKKGVRFICFKAIVDGKEKESFAVFEKSEKEKSRDKWKIIRLKYH